MGLPITGVYTDAMGMFVRAMQRQAQIEDDAVIGPDTWRTIGERT